MLPDESFALSRVIIDGLFVFAVTAPEVIPTQENRIDCCHCSLDSLRVVVRNFGGKPRQIPAPVGQLRFTHTIAFRCPRARRDAHGRAVAEAPIRSAAVREQPRSEFAAVTDIRIQPPVLFHRFDKIFPFPAVHNGLRHGAGHDRVIRKRAAAAEQRKVLRLDIPPLINRAHDIADYRPSIRIPPCRRAAKAPRFYVS